MNKEDIYKKYGIPQNDIDTGFPLPMLSYKFIIEIVGIDDSLVKKSVKSFHFDKIDNKTSIKIIFRMDNETKMLMLLNSLDKNAIIVYDIEYKKLFTISPLTDYNIKFDLDYYNGEICYVELSCDNIKIKKSDS